jgi:hypothetical protein
VLEMDDVRYPRQSSRVVQRFAVLLAALSVLLGVASSAEARTPPGQDPFYRYSGATPLADVAPGTVLKTRTVPYHLVGFPLPVKTTQLLYRSTGQLGQATVNVTSVIRPALSFGKQKLISYQSAYDSLNPDDEPSYAISGGLTLGGLLPNAESLILAPLLLQGYSVVVPDTEGQSADFAAGSEYGKNTLDSLRATFSSSAVGLPQDTKAALIGYSGGAIATDWAAELAPTYASDVNQRIVGSSMGGVLVDPAHNLPYVDGSLAWAGVMPMALIGAARSFDVDLTPYLSDYGKQILDKLKNASIINVIAQYPGLTFAQLTKPEYSTPESIPVFVELANKLIMGTGGTPSAPLQITQGAGGEFEGTLGDKPGIGPGDGVMIAGDVRTLARDYCSRGVKVEYSQLDALSHVGAAVAWYPGMLSWVNDRFAGRTAPENCSQIPAGNSLAPITVAP